MPFSKISFVNFRNLTNDTMIFNEKNIFFVGENGQGKSNALESLYLSACGSSFRTCFDTEVVTHNKDESSVVSVYKQSNLPEDTISVKIVNKRKKIEKNSKIVSDRKELIRTIPSVLFCHDDLDFIIGSPERKRWFLDQTISMYDDIYLDFLRKYKKILKSRNLVLKDDHINKNDLLDTLDIQMIECGIELITRRRKCIDEFNKLFGILYKEISEIENISIEYCPSWINLDKNHIYELLKSKREKEKILGSTLSGPHRDKITFLRDMNSFIPYSSTGQRRLLALLLRVTQTVFYTKKTNRFPVLFADDVMLELDQNKRESFFKLLPEYDQLFCTFLPDEPYSKYKTGKTAIIKIKRGDWTYEQ